MGDPGLESNWKQKLIASGHYDKENQSVENTHSIHGDMQAESLFCVSIDTVFTGITKIQMKM